MYELSALDGSQHQTISLFWPFMFRINLWVVVVALVAVSVAGGGAEDIDAIFPPRLAAVLKKVADAKSIPYGAMISGMLALICAFSPASSFFHQERGKFWYQQDWGNALL